ncbi:SMI1/KNR4 family protein [Myxococcus sp. CA040A]|uniref:SMI1/KNR4 family protein n=1 Tax=Myxococcus sp. CA040A TaxID=2741738 RepID=UPI00157B8504|nr:SMI1/KNR4 family protein [Myxococcus sp. CA040A]NTX02658.1 SMI1/KNR4 family protein [Myxococcus sp. CA040A]
MRDLIALLERYAPGYSRQIQGASTWELDNLEEAFGQPLPDVYRDFALKMGENGGALLSHVSINDFLDVADIYQIRRRDAPPQRFLFIFGDPNPLTRFHYWLDLEAPFEEGDFQVVRFPLFQDAWKTKLQRSYVSFREMLYLWAMGNVHLPSFSHRALYQQGDEKRTTAEEFAQYLGKMGFVRLPYPRYSMLFERDDAAIRLYRPPDSSCFEVHVGMYGLDRLKHFQAVIEDNTDIEKSIWEP